MIDAALLRLAERLTAVEREQERRRIEVPGLSITQLATADPSAVSFVSFTDVSQAYATLLLVIAAQASTAANVAIRFSSDGTTFDSGTNYDWQQMSGAATTVSALEVLAGASITAGALSAFTNTRSPLLILLPYYASTTHHKSLLSWWGYKSGTSSGNLQVGSAAGWWRNTAAIKGVQVISTAGTLSAGSHIALYGVQ